MINCVFFVIALSFYQFTLGFLRVHTPKKFVFQLTRKTYLSSVDPEAREEDLNQLKDLDLILSERAKRFNLGPTSVAKEQCLLLTVESRILNLKSQPNVSSENEYFSFEESLNELSELVGTAGLEVKGICVQKLQVPNTNSYINSGKAYDLMALVNSTGVRTVVVDDDLTPKQQNNLENLCASYGGTDVKILDRTAIILEIFAQHAQSREGQLQVELAMLEYRRTRGPRARSEGGDSGAGFRGPGETKMETDRRVIQDKILRVKKEIELLGMQRKQHRKTRDRLGIPVVALVGYTNAGKSTLMNRLSRAGVLAENMLFATLDPTTRKLNLPRVIRTKETVGETSVGVSTTSNRPILVVEEDGTTSEDLSEKTDSIENTESRISAIDASSLSTQLSSSKVNQEAVYFETYADCDIGKGQEIFLTDTVGFISKLPTDLIAAFRATLEEVKEADVLIHVCDRSSPVWRKQRRTVLKELAAIGCTDVPIVELWNKIDVVSNPVEIMLEASKVPVDIDAVFGVKSDSESVAVDSASSVSTDLITDADVGVPTAAIPTSTSSDTTKQRTPSFQEAKRAQAYSAYNDGKGQGGLDKSSKGYKSARGTKRAPVVDNYFWSGEDGEYITQSDSTSSTSSIPGSFSSSTSDGAVYDSINPTMNSSKPTATSRGQIFTVAASVKSGLGFNNFLIALEKALTLKHETVTLFVPYDKDDGTVALVFSQATIESVEYKDTGTFIICKVTDNLMAKVERFRVNDDVLYL